MERAYNLLILGTTGTGKSHQAALLARHADCRTLILHAHPDQTYTKVFKNHYAAISVFSPYTRRPIHLSKVRSRVVQFFSTGLTSDENKEFLIAFSDVSRRSAPCMVIIDEAHQFLKMNTCPKEFISLVRAARHFQISFVFVTHRLQDITPDIRSVITDVACFRLIGDTNAELVKVTFADSDASIAYLQRIPTRHYAMIDPATGEVGRAQR